MAYKVGERVSIEMHGMLGRSRRDWSELSEYERSAWIVFNEASVNGYIWEY